VSPYDIASAFAGVLLIASGIEIVVGRGSGGR
jgi:hypothetical protein